MKTIHVKKGHILHAKGEKNTKAYEVKSGLLRSYSIDAKGKEHIFMFAPEGWVVGDASAMDKDAISELFIDALEDSVLVEIEKDFENFNLPTILPLMKRIAVLQKRIIQLMSATAYERYEDFVATYPNIIQRVPQKMIASYLGITPEALSKVKGDNFRNETKSFINVH